MRENRHVFLLPMVLGLIFGFIASSSAQTISEQRAGNRPCREYEKKYCADVKRGGGRILNCLKSHEKDLSQECKQRLSEKETRRGKPSASTSQESSIPAKQP